MSDQFKYTTGLRNVGSYLAAGSPYVTSSNVSQDTEQEIQFPRVTNNIIVRLDSAPGGQLHIHYRSTGSLPNVAINKHYWTLSSQGEEINMNIKTKEIYISAVNGDCDFSLYADITNIPAARMYQHTGSGVDE